MKDAIKKHKVGVVSAIIEMVLVVAVMCEVFVGDYNPIAANVLILLIWLCVVITVVDVVRNWA